MAVRRPAIKFLYSLMKKNDKSIYRHSYSGGKNAIVQPFVLLEGRNPGQLIRKEFHALKKSQSSLFLKDIIVLHVC